MSDQIAYLVYRLLKYCKIMIFNLKNNQTDTVFAADPTVGSVFELLMKTPPLSLTVKRSVCDLGDTWTRDAFKSCSSLNMSMNLLSPFSKSFLTWCFQVLLQQEDPPQDQREEVHLQVQLQQTGARQLPLHRHGLRYD